MLTHVTTVVYIRISIYKLILDNFRYFLHLLIRTFAMSITISVFIKFNYKAVGSKLIWGGGGLATVETLEGYRFAFF